MLFSSTFIQRSTQFCFVSEVPLQLQNAAMDLILLFHRCTRASYVYNGCLAWYNVVLYNCLSWYKFVNTYLYHSRQLYNIQLPMGFMC